MIKKQKVETNRRNLMDVGRELEEIELRLIGLTETEKKAFWTVMHVLKEYQAAPPPPQRFEIPKQ